MEPVSRISPIQKTDLQGPSHFFHRWQLFCIPPNLIIRVTLCQQGKGGKAGKAVKQKHLGKKCEAAETPKESMLSNSLGGARDRAATAA